MISCFLGLKDSWTAAEDQKLLKLQRVKPSQWSLISQSIPGRTAQQCRARFFQVQVREETASVSDRVHREGLIGPLEDHLEKTPFTPIFC